MGNAASELCFTVRSCSGRDKRISILHCARKHVKYYGS